MIVMKLIVHVNRNETQSKQKIIKRVLRNRLNACIGICRHLSNERVLSSERHCEKENIIISEVKASTL
jgi:uncharacterized protein involved in tolerance to divalent cations